MSRRPPIRSRAVPSATSSCRLRTPALGLALALLAGPACSRRPADQQAKARVFAPEEPIGAQAAARERLDARALARDPAVAARVLRMSREETGLRLGAHRVHSKVTFEWTRSAPAAADGGATLLDPVRLTEQARLDQAASGDFRLRLENDHNEGWELVRTRAGIFVRGLFGPFRRRRSDRSDPNRLREQALTPLETFDRLARGLRLSAPTEGREGGRPVLSYRVEGGGARPREAQAQDLPPVQYPEAPGAAGPKGTSGPDLDTARRLAFEAFEQPGTLSGRLVIDAQTAAPLAAELAGHFRVPPQRPDEPPADLELQISFATTDVGGPVLVENPASEPPPATPHAVKDPLRFLGRVAAQGPASSEEPVEDGEGGE